MDKVVLRFPGAILVTMVIAIMFTMFPLQDGLSVWRPDWVALTLVHWALVMPKRVTLLMAWFVGLLMDALFGTLLGQYALGFTLVLYMSLRLAERINPLIIWQQAFMILVTLSVYLLINLWVLGVSGNSPDSWNYWLPLFSSVAIWPIWHRFLNLFHITRKHL